MDEDANRVVVEPKLKEPPPRKLPAVAAPAPADPERIRGGPAWEELGAEPGSYVATLIAAYTNPSRFFRTMRRTGGSGQAFVFAATSLFVGASVSAFLILFYSALTGGPSLGFGLFFLIFFLMGFLAGLAVTTLIFLAALWMFGALTHLVLLMLGGGPKCTYECTLRAVAYSYGVAAPIAMIPLVGSFAYLPFAFVLLIVGIWRLNEVGLTRAVFAAVTMLLGSFAAILLLGFAIVASVPALSFDESAEDEAVHEEYLFEEGEALQEEPAAQEPELSNP